MKKYVSYFLMMLFLENCNKGQIMPSPPSRAEGLVLFTFDTKQKSDWFRNKKIYFYKLNDKNQIVAQQNDIAFFEPTIFGFFFPNQLIKNGYNALKVVYPDESVQFLELKNTEISADVIRTADVYLDGVELIDKFESPNLTLFAL